MQTRKPARPFASSQIAARPKETARQVAELARQFVDESVEVIWFGSWPRGEPRERSDIVIALSLGQSIPLDRMAAFREAVEELSTLYEIDLVDVSTVGDPLGRRFSGRECALRRRTSQGHLCPNRQLPAAPRISRSQTDRIVFALVGTRFVISRVSSQDAIEVYRW
jgi:predicted nucleotidyltransferase